jgi:hypothetical protein
VAALVGIGSKDEIAGMIAAQLIAAHNAAMECYRRAMIGSRVCRDGVVEIELGSAIHGCRKILHRRADGQAEAATRARVASLPGRKLSHDSNRLAEVADVTSARLGRSDVTPLSYGR